ncbi:biotin--[acetyl-CoA-carboxylase] ligase [Corynebacterium sp. zg254]|uniref:biotin--[biotin carboxyl-carrier protein] ligase n=1 Tax=Corynebacterium zhongnanshanii TaxID=2768834 RepID=A0ABQ6VF83_9CORY|nr:MULTISPECIES: biotin--[acetyl-CoA-carboxylase] ligase [Corynebacterium]KAB3522950.1 biotin--[acetyl-CoA-carboxylase] ligase [Corynebacterium zhongnanshanii]MCR5913971.1 biotin--[acetyl-CoA-carboxylase] ligase [Corynebacterium sp. zg254]
MSTPMNRTPLNADSLSRRLAAAGYAHVDVVQSTGSTNSDMVRANPPHLSVVLAEEQTAGKGRLGRQWVSPAYSQVICTVVVELAGVKPASLGLVPLLTANALATAVNEDVATAVKWPNDLLVHGRKLAGILVEAIQITPTPKLAIGFGLNYDLERPELPVEHATSYTLEGGNRSREDLIVALLTQLLEAVQRFMTMGGAPATVLPRYRQLSATLGTQVRALLPGGDVLEGTAVDIADDGSLTITTPSGHATVSAGDVEHLRS